VQAVLKDEKLIPFLAVIDTHLTETAKLADIVLPAASTLEIWGIESRPSLHFVPQLNVVQPVVQPRGEAKEIGEILIGVAERMGGELRSRFAFKNSLDYVDSVVSRFPELVNVGGVACLRKRGVWSNPTSLPTFKLFEVEKFDTASGKYQVFPGASHPRDLATMLRSGRGKTGSLVLTTFLTGLRSSSNANFKWLTEVSHENRLWIHPETAADNGVRDDDEVEVTSEAGSVRVRVRITWGIRPGLVALAKGFGHEAYGNIARSKRFSSKDPDTKLIWWNRAESDVNTNILIPVSLDPVSGGQARTAIEVRLKKC